MPSAQEAAANFEAAHHVEEQLGPYARMRPGSSAPMPNKPILYLDDFSDIPFLKDIAGVELYQHRARARAHDDSIFAAVTPEVPGYEAYCRTRLGMGAPEFVQAEPEGGDLLQVARSCMRGAAFQRIAARAKASGGLVLHPYMGIQPVFQLAATVSAFAEVPVQVIAPPPPVTWIANDKRSITELAVHAAGAEFVVETEESRLPSELAAHLRAFATRHARVGLKRTRCASAMGNRVFTAQEITSADEPTLAGWVQAFLEKTEWDGAEEVLVVAWEETDCSPSTQLWIPPRESGQAVRLDGIYEQILEGKEKVFVGSRPSTLPAPVNQTLAYVSTAVATALQQLGYIGRCSFDFVVPGDLNGDFDVRLTECNGRWGGTSTPMFIVDRLVGAPRPMYRAQDFVHPDLVGVPFAEILARVGEAAFDHRTKQGQFIFYNVGPLAGSGKLDVIALADSKDQADEALTEVLPRLLGV